MFSIWWLGFIPAVVYILGGVLHLPKHFRWYENDAPEKREYAYQLTWRYCWQFGLLFAALSFMLMRSTIRMASTGQYILLGVLLVVEIAAVWFLYIPVKREVEEKFGEQK